MARTRTVSTLAPLATRSRLPLIAALAVQVARAVTVWSQRHRSRQVLMHLDDVMLDDIGITRAQAELEANRRFWQP